MARQMGIFPLSGSIGEVTFVKHGTRYFARRKSSLNREQFMNDTRFKDSRKAMTEFGAASLGSKLLRKAFVLTGTSVADRDQYARLTGFLRKLLLTDTIHVEGERRLSASNLDELRHFNWSNAGQMSSILHEPVGMVADQAAGTITASIPALEPSEMISMHRSATHYRITLEGAAIDFDKQSLDKAFVASEWLSLEELQPELVMKISLKDTAGRFLFGGVKIQFAQEINGRFYELYDKTKTGFTFEYLGQVPATPARSAAQILAAGQVAGQAAVEEALVIIDWEAQQAAAKEGLVSAERSSIPKKHILTQRRDKGKRVAMKQA